MNAVPICDEFIFVEDADQEEKLLVALGWQWFDVLLQVVQVFNCFVNDFLMGYFLAEEALFFIVMIF
jgi:hypothetical protein